MTMKTKQELIAQIAALLNEVIEVDEQAAQYRSLQSPWKCSQSRNARKLSKDFPNTLSVSLWRRRKSRT